MNDDLGDDGAAAEQSDAFGELVVVGDESGDGLEAAGAGEIVAAEAEGGTEAEFADADEGCDEGAGDEIDGDAEGFPDAGGGAGDGAIRTGDEGGLVHDKARGEAAEVVAGDADVAVVDDEDGMAGFLQKIDQHADFAVGGGGFTFEETDGDLRMGVNESADSRDSGVVEGVDAEEDFKLGVVLGGVAGDGVFEARIKAADGFQDGNGGQRSRLGTAADEVLFEAIEERREDRHDLVGEGQEAEDIDGDSQQCPEWEVH